MEENDLLFCARVGRRPLLHSRDGNDKGDGEGQLAKISKQTERSIEGVACCIVVEEEALDDDDDGEGDCSIKMSGALKRDSPLAWISVNIRPYK